MCYGMGCPYENGHGECTLKNRLRPEDAACVASEPLDPFELEFWAWDLIERILGRTVHQSDVPDPEDVPVDCYLDQVSPSVCVHCRSSRCAIWRTVERLMGGESDA